VLKAPLNPKQLTACLVNAYSTACCHVTQLSTVAKNLLSPIHTSNNVRSNIHVVGWLVFNGAFNIFVAKNGNNDERVYCKILSFQQCPMLLQYCCHVVGVDGALLTKNYINESTHFMYKYIITIIHENAYHTEQNRWDSITNLVLF